MSKLIDPKQREEWVSPDEEWRVEYRPYTGVILTDDVHEIARQYIRHGVTRVWYAGELVKKPPEGWDMVLPTDVQTVVFTLIMKITVLDDGERQDSQLPPGSASTDVTGAATSAGGADGDA